ncbi:glycosyltransferase [Candidatus Parcubacteria bacterium]|nr:glycosyltransferase [Candidatus Parcubacteria bacterium]
MPAYNAEKNIAEAIDSVIQQTYADWELIVVDDGSTDLTAEIVKSYVKSDCRIRYIYQTNKRLGAARNTGLRAAKGKWLAFLDSDDLWLPDKLLAQTTQIGLTDVDVLFTTGYILHDNTGLLEPYETLTGTFDPGCLYRLLFEHNRIPVLSVIYKKELLDRVGYQDESLKVYGCEDWDYWLRCCIAGAKFVGMKLPTFKYRIHEGGMSKNSKNMHMAGCYVLFKNFQPALFKPAELRDAEARLVSQVHYLVNHLYTSHDLSDIPQLVTNLNSLELIKINTRAILLFLRLLGIRSRKLSNYFLSRG